MNGIVNDLCFQKAMFVNGAPENQEQQLMLLTISRPINCVFKTAVLATLQKCGSENQWVIKRKSKCAQNVLLMSSVCEKTMVCFQKAIVLGNSVFEK